MGELTGWCKQALVLADKMILNDQVKKTFLFTKGFFF